ncbi:DUF4157 domain-containing protein [Actinocrispum sp. NPDC049592]|uniref:eCIS core domain-containing protein n=1 Tax=Actinocrispum sp. NPDC049592 TaxID=3154835 RepID=UPI0034248C78
MHTDTAGERLAARVRQLRARRTATIGWLAAFDTMLNRASSLPTPATSPLRRAEAAVPPAWSVEPDAVSWPPAAEPALAMPTEVRQRLRPVIGAGIERTAIHIDDRADEFATAHGADAVTVGQEIHFRTGRFRPTEPEGLALLAHEAWHATADQRGGTTHRATEGGAAEEESHAIALERAVLGAALPTSATSPARNGYHGATAHRTQPVRQPARPPAAQPPATPAPADSPAGRPMTAGRNRDLVVRQEDQQREGLDPGVLREQLYRDVLRQVKIDMERGG